MSFSNIYVNTCVQLPSNLVLLRERKKNLFYIITTNNLHSPTFRLANLSIVTKEDCIIIINEGRNEFQIENYANIYSTL